MAHLSIVRPDLPVDLVGDDLILACVRRPDGPIDLQTIRKAAVPRPEQMCRHNVSPTKQSVIGTASHVRSSRTRRAHAATSTPVLLFTRIKTSVGCGGTIPNRHMEPPRTGSRRERPSLSERPPVPPFPLSSGPLSPAVMGSSGEVKGVAAEDVDHGTEQSSVRTRRRRKIVRYNFWVVREHGDDILVLAVLTCRCIFIFFV